MRAQQANDGTSVLCARWCLPYSILRHLYLRTEVKKSRREERKRREAEEAAAKAAIRRVKKEEQSAKHKAMDEKYKMDIPPFATGEIRMLDDAGGL